MKSSIRRACLLALPLALACSTPERTGWIDAARLARADSEPGQWMALGRTWHGQRFASDQVHFVCPWHGYEYDLRTGECAADRRLKLKTYEVVRRGEDIYVRAG